jgi:hypothetical protein
LVFSTVPDENNNTKYLMLEICYDQIDEMPENITKKIYQKETVLRLIYLSRNEWRRNRTLHASHELGVSVTWHFYWRLW